ncbi:MAG: hypothetical protein ACJAZ3_000761 [Sphingobacteriales bacterium]|jgi:hypothetical protein
MFKLDKLWLGAIYGALLPVLFFGFAQIIRMLINYMVSDSFLYILCIGCNLILFRILIAKEKDQLSRGVLLATFIYAFIFFFTQSNL